MQWKLITDEVLGNKKGGGKTKSVIENVYQQKLLALKERLATLTEVAFTSDETIKAKIRAKIEKDNGEIEKLYKEQKLTRPQANNLRKIIGIIGDTELAKELKDFKNKRIIAQKRA